MKLLYGFNDFAKSLNLFPGMSDEVSKLRPAGSSAMQFPPPNQSTKF